jgi:hypothetical protein
MAVSGVALAQKQKKHEHKSGHNLLGGKLKQNGKHQIDKAGTATVSAEVSNGKVTAMSAIDAQKGNLPARKVKSRKKMADVQPGSVRVAANGDIQLAQAGDWYYGWSFDTGADEYYYWYPAEDVVVTETWVEYTAY